jgi:hypothetical protein
MDDLGDFTCDCDNPKCYRSNCLTCCYCGAPRSAPQHAWHPKAGTWVSAAGEPPLRVEEVRYDYGVAKLSDGNFVAFSCLEQADAPSQTKPQHWTLDDLLTDIRLIKADLPLTMRNESPSAGRAALLRIEAYVRWAKEVHRGRE